MNTRLKDSIGTPYEHDVWFVDFRKSGQKRLVRYFRRKGLNKSRAKQLAHTVYMESSKNGFVGSYTYGIQFSIQFVYCW